jgi:glyoxylase-like metal-dependent hydrolase (beta-lactamase superfamily II)
MKLFFHYCLGSFCNCYVAAYEGTAGQNGKAPAIMIDPGTVDAELIELVEKNNFDLQAVLLTHSHINHSYGILCLKRIYDFEIYAATTQVLGYKANLVKDGDVLNFGPFSIHVISTPGHSADSVVYMLDQVLFTGDALSAGKTGAVTNSFGAAQQAATINSKVLTLPGNLVVLPGHGPPSTLEAERHFNAGVKKYRAFKPARSKRFSLVLGMME